MLICTNSIWHWSNTTIKMKETPLVPFESMACFLYLLRPFEQILGGVSLQNHSINTSSTFELVNEVPQEQLSCCEILFVRKCQIMCRPVLSPFLPGVCVVMCCELLLIWKCHILPTPHRKWPPPPKLMLMLNISTLAFTPLKFRLKAAFYLLSLHISPQK